MKIGINVNNDFFKICEKYGLERGLIFDKICYLQLIHSNYDLFTDLCLIHLLETMIADGLVTIVGDVYKPTKMGLNLLKEVGLLNGSPMTSTKFKLTKNFVTEYISLYRDSNNKFLRAPDGKGGTRSLGAGSTMCLETFQKWYKKFGEELEEKISESKEEGILSEEITLNDIILKVTKTHLDEFSKSSYNYCPKANYFIMKHEVNKQIKSTLYDLCEDYIFSPPVETQQSMNFFEKHNI